MAAWTIPSNPFSLIRPTTTATCLLQREPAYLLFSHSLRLSPVQISFQCRRRDFLTRQAPRVCLINPLTCCSLQRETQINVTRAKGFEHPRTKCHHPSPTSVTIRCSFHIPAMAPRDIIPVESQDPIPLMHQSGHNRRISTSNRKCRKHGSIWISNSNSSRSNLST